MERLRTILWDCDGVMWFHNPFEAFIISDGLGVTTNAFEAEFNRMISSYQEYFKDKKVRRGELYDIIEQTMPTLAINNISPKKFMQVWSDLKFDLDEVNEEILPVLKLLSERGYRHQVVTDWWKSVQEELMKGYGIQPYIDKIYSCDDGLLKANPESAKIIPAGKEEEYIMIGDNLEMDICFAENAGIKSVWFNRNCAVKNNTRFKPTYEVGSLLELLSIL